MDLAGVDRAAKRIDDETLPKLEALLAKVASDLDAIVSRLDGATITITIHLKKENNEDSDKTSSPDSAALPCHGRAEPA